MSEHRCRVVVWLEIVFIASLVVPMIAWGQRCSGDSHTGCSHPGVVCSPVEQGGVGSSGVCTTKEAQPGERECNCLPPPQLNLSGVWAGNDGAIYYLRQVGDELWWAGMSVESPGGLTDLHKGLRFSNVLHASISGTSITGDWADVPRGPALNYGTLTLSASDQRIQRQAATGGFAATVWTRIGPAPPASDIFDIFDAVKKNQNEIRDHSLLDNLKPAKSKPVMMFGNLTVEEGDPDPMHVGYPAHHGRTYNEFICLDNNDHPPDGDIDFAITVDLAKLAAQPGFWTYDWEVDHDITPESFANKLKRQDWIKVESIMYGGTTECGDDGMPSFLLPGWEQPGALGVLFNGFPLFGQMDLTDRNATSARINAMIGRPLSFGMKVRITGIPVLDCGHYWTHPCDENDPSVQNQEIHPLYSIDFLQDFQRPRPFATITGVWSSNDAGTYYVRQLGSVVWWLGLSVDEGRSFANVFQGTLQSSGIISGKWADIPLGKTTTAGTMAIDTDGAQSTQWKLRGSVGNFGTSSWEKLYDVNDRRVIIVFDSLVVKGPSLPQSPHPVELKVAGQRLEIDTKNPRLLQTPGAQSSAADLQARVPVNLSDGSALRLSASFAGYRADWVLQDATLRPGTYVQAMKAPRQLRPPNSDASGGSSSGMRSPAECLAGDAAKPLPEMTIHYHIEEPASR